MLIGQPDETDNGLRGFDAGLCQLLAWYILGAESRFELTQVDSSTRESVLQSSQVDAVFATCSIIPSRQEVISFAGPCYTSRQAVLVKKGNTEITGVDSLAGKNVATQSGFTGPDILAEFAPEAVIQEFANDQEARAALEQGRVDAYVTDYTLLLNAIVKDPGAYDIAGDVFGPEDNCGTGLPKDSDGVALSTPFWRRSRRTAPGPSCGRPAWVTAPASTPPLRFAGELYVQIFRNVPGAAARLLWKRSRAAESAYLKARLTDSERILYYFSRPNQRRTGGKAETAFPQDTIFHCRRGYPYHCPRKQSESLDL